ncbi:MAG: hypothetical protein C4521_10695 [Actinobacteria bacterium]|nr:MAG: hypothetical protein C4521_10695 [Actinomycetota bacterium]
MIVRRIVLSGFRKFDDRAIELSDGLNVVRGPNEAGKSTIHTALRTLLYDKATTTDRKVKALKSWGAEEMFRLEMDFEVDGTLRRLTKDFAARTCELSLDGTSSCVDPDEIQSSLYSWLGCPTEKFFESTVCVKQDELAKLDRHEMAERLQRLMAGGDVAARTALKKLEKARKDLLVGLSSPAKSPGPIKQAMDGLEELQRRGERVGEELARVDEARVLVAEADKRLGGLRRELAALSATIEKNEKARALKTELETTRRAYAARSRARALTGEISVLRSERTALGRVATDEGEEVVRELRSRRAALDEKTRRLEETAAVGAVSERPPLTLPITGALILLLGLAAGAALTPFLFLLAVVGAALLAYGLSPILGRLRSGSGGEASALRSLKEEIEAGEVEMRSGLERLGVGSLEEAERRLAAAEELDRRMSAKEGELRGVTGGKTLEDFEAETQGLATEIERKEEVLAEHASSEVDPVKLERLRQEAGRIEREVAELDKRRTEATYLLKHTDADPEDAARLEEEAAELRERLERLEQRRRVYEAAIEGIGRAEQDTMAKATEVIQQSVGELASEITGGRYEEVRVDEKDLAMTVLSREKGEWASVDDELSQATREQFYLAARLGLLQELCGEARPPLLLDDPFVTFDSERRDRTMRLLRRLSEGRQILLFTCDEEYDGYADRVIELAGKDERA